MKKTFLFLLALIPAVLLIIPSNQVFAANTRWAAINRAGDTSGIQKVPDGYGLTAVGAGGNFENCSLYIQTAPVINGEVNFDAVSDWTWSKNEGGYVQNPDDPNGPPIYKDNVVHSPATCSRNIISQIQQSSPYYDSRYGIDNRNTVVTGWNWEINYGGIGKYNICYYQEYASLSNINNRSPSDDFKNGSCDENRSGELIPKVVARAPQGHVIVGIGFSLQGHGESVHRLVASRSDKIYPAPIVVEQKSRHIGQGVYEPYESPATQSSPIELPNIKYPSGAYWTVILQVSEITGDFAQNGPYSWTSESSGVRYLRNQYGVYSFAEMTSNSVHQGSMINLQFSSPGQKIIKLTSANGKTGFAYINIAETPVTDVCPNIDGTQATIPSGMIQDSFGNCITPYSVPTCEITAPAEADRKTNTPISIRASGGDGTYAWSVVPDGNIFSNSSNSATAVFNTPDEKWISVDSAGMSGVCRVEIVATDVCPNISGNQQTIPDGMSIDDTGNCVALPVTKPSCAVVSPRTWERKIDTPITVKASGGDGSYVWDFLLSRFLNSTLWKGTILESFGDSAVMSFASSGAKIITVSSSGLSGECVAVILGAADPQPEPELTCEIKSDSLADQKPGTLLSAEASGGNGTYEWSVATAGDITPNSPSNTASVIFAESGTNVVNVSSGGASGSCSIFLFEGDSEPEPEEPTEEYPKVNCFPSEQTVEIGERVNFSATGGDNNFSWSSPAVPGSPNNTASAIFNNQGRKVVGATSADSTGFCVVDVSRPAPTVNVWSTPRTDFTLPFEGTATVSYDINWDSDHADTCTGSWMGDIGRRGSQPFTNGRGTYNYRVTCINESGENSDTTTVTIREVPICNFTANPDNIVPPQISTLEWECRYAQSCSIDNGIGSVSNTGGTKTVRPTKTTEYTLSCSGRDGGSFDSAKVSIDFIPWLKEIIPIWRND